MSRQEALRSVKGTSSLDYCNIDGPRNIVLLLFRDTIPQPIFYAHLVVTPYPTLTGPPGAKLQEDRKLMLNRKTGFVFVLFILVLMLAACAVATPTPEPPP